MIRDVNVNVNVNDALWRHAHHHRCVHADELGAEIRCQRDPRRRGTRVARGPPHAPRNEE